LYTGKVKVMINSPYPFESEWKKIKSKLESSPALKPSGITRDTYLDMAEKIVRELCPLQNEEGLITDPYLPCDIHRELISSARFIGALGQLIKAGRCLDLRQQLFAAVQVCFHHWAEPKRAPEFRVKELIYAWEAMEGYLSPSDKVRWEESLKNYDPAACYATFVYDMHNNFTTFALIGEFLRYKHGFIQGIEMVEGLIEDQISRDLFTAAGLYKDPGVPLTYSTVVTQQWDFLLKLGYDGKFASAVDEIVRRAGLTTLLMQSTTGQAPFGGRSNQYQFVEGHLACFFETRASYYAGMEDSIMAGAFKRAAHKAAECALPWIMEMAPPRCIKYAGDPALGHGHDGYASYIGYASLAASLFATAWHLSDESIEERYAPYEICGYVLDLNADFHKTMAACSGYFVEVETRSTGHRYDSTGLGRIHKSGILGETAISGTIIANPDYSMGAGIQAPKKNLAFGPGWKNSAGDEFRLADFGSEIADVQTIMLKEEPGIVSFQIIYKGEFGGVQEVKEEYTLTPQGLQYEFQLAGSYRESYMLVPLLENDGELSSVISMEDGKLQVLYRGFMYTVSANGSAKTCLLKDEHLSNRNGTYATGVIHAGKVQAALTLVP
jgi:hypothetical protein